MGGQPWRRRCKCAALTRRARRWPQAPLMPPLIECAGCSSDTIPCTVPWLQILQFDEGTAKVVVPPDTPTADGAVRAGLRFWKTRLVWSKTRKQTIANPHHRLPLRHQGAGRVDHHPRSTLRRRKRTNLVIPGGIQTEVHPHRTRRSRQVLLQRPQRRRRRRRRRRQVVRTPTTSSATCEQCHRLTRPHPSRQ